MERYRRIIPDYTRFLAYLHRPRPTTLRLVTTRARPDVIRRRLEAKGFQLTPLPFPPHFYRVDAAPYPISKTLEHWLGLIYIQEASAGLAAWALDVTPGDLVLDLCAAPGGKTLQLAERMDQRGGLVANDVSETRVRALLSNIMRLTSPLPLVTRWRGQRFPTGMTFRHVLADVPCSAEGNARDTPRLRGGERVSYIRGLARRQIRLLQRAIQLTAPGGTILYATCTFAPEENEGVVHAVLASEPVDLVPIELPVPTAPGLTAFEDQTYDPRLTRARRVYFHHLDSGGLFMAKLVKLEGSPPQGPPIEPLASESVRATVDRELGEAFGVPNRILDRFVWFQRGPDIWVTTSAVAPPASWSARSHRGRWISLGLRALRRTGRAWKPTTVLLQMLQDHIRQRRIALTAGELYRMLMGQPLQRAGLPEGYVALDLDGFIVGCGWSRRGGLTHQIPIERARALLDVLATEGQAGV